MKKWTLAVGSVLLLIGCASSAPSPEYFPPGTFSEGETEWYSGHLLALNQEPLWPLASDPEVTVYRFTWLRTFHNPIVVRVKVSPNGSSDVYSVRADGAGGYEPGVIVERSRRHLSRSVTSALLSRINESGFWNLPAQKEASTVVVDGRVVEQIVIGLDGAQWILEAVDDGKYHVFDDWSPEGGAYRSAMLHLLEFSRFDLEPIY